MPPPVCDVSWQDPPLCVEGGKPSCRVIAELCPKAIEELDRRGPPRQHGEVILHPGKSELGDDGVPALLEQEAPALVRELVLDQPKLPPAQMKTVDVIRGLAPRVREEHLGRALLDDGVRDRARQG